jgi:hypothetical protein
MKSARRLSCLFIAASLLSPLDTAGDDKKLEQRIAALEVKAIEESELWSGALKFSGVIEVDARYMDEYSDDSSSDLVISTAELGGDATLTENLSATLVLLYEEEANLEVDIATISYTHSTHGFSLTLTLFIKEYCHTV